MRNRRPLQKFIQKTWTEIPLLKSKNDEQKIIDPTTQVILENTASQPTTSTSSARTDTQLRSNNEVMHEKEIINPQPTEDLDDITRQPIRRTKRTLKVPKRYYDEFGI